MSDDPYLWLEDIDGERALDWVRARNAETLPELEADPRYPLFLAEATAILEDDERIPLGALRRGFIYNFWQDANAVRGIWRRASLESYVANEPQWETLLDVDALAEQEDENWVFAGVESLAEDPDHCLVSLSRGGADASVVREFDVATRSFVEDGFVLPEAKTDVTWIDRDTLVVGTDFGPGSMTASGYPRVAKLWRRAAPLDEAPVVLEGEDTDVTVGVYRLSRPEGAMIVAYRMLDFWRTKRWIVEPRGWTLRELALPESASVHASFDRRLLVLLREPWRDFAAGALIAFDAESESAELVVEPGGRQSIADTTATRGRVYVEMLTDVRSELYEASRDGQGSWTLDRLSLPAGTLGVVTASAYDDPIFVTHESYLQPRSLQFLGDGRTPARVRAMRTQFEARGVVEEQFEARSADGERIPYTMIRREGLEGSAPTVLYGYGGFEVSLLPDYLGNRGKLWVERGGTYVVANIRGGGEFGPKWHRAALESERQRSFDDFLAVARDLIDRHGVEPKQIGIVGGSNGGLLVGAAMIQAPELFGAVVCQVPLLDMLRYHKLQAGASWVGEYGDPEDPELAEVLRGYSPYHNVRPGETYPEVFFVTSTRDDRVHPGHARKMAARMLEQGHRVSYFENIEGGHGAGANLKQHARLSALEFLFLHRMLA